MCNCEFLNVYLRYTIKCDCFPSRRTDCVNDFQTVTFFEFAVLDFVPFEVTLYKFDPRSKADKVYQSVILQKEKPTVELAVVPIFLLKLSGVEKALIIMVDM